MYDIRFTDTFNKDFSKLTKEMQILFYKRIKKISVNYILSKHLKYGIPYFSEKVTKSARFVYYMENNTLYCIRIFKTHKEYEKGYKSFK